MAYIGKEPANVGQRPSEDTFTATANQTVFNLTADVDYESDIFVSINGVVQTNAAFGLDGTGNRTLTFSSGMTVDDVVRVVHHGYKPMTVTVADDIVTTQKIAADAVDGTKIADNAVGNEHLEDDTVGVAELSATGTASNTTFLRGDNSWTEVDALPTQTSHSGKYLTTNGSAASWDTLDTDANTTTKGIYEHSNVISVNYVIGTNNNALTAGPITINSNISVTVPSGSTWVIA